MSASNLKELGAAIHEVSRAHGFYNHEVLWTDRRFPNGERGPIGNVSLPAEKLALIHSEVSEVLEELRKGDTEAEELEVADIIIRALDYAAWRGMDMDAAIDTKMRVNSERPRLHGKVF